MHSVSFILLLHHYQNGGVSFVNLPSGVLAHTLNVQGEVRSLEVVKQGDSVTLFVLASSFFKFTIERETYDSGARTVDAVYKTRQLIYPTPIVCIDLKDSIMIYLT